MDIVHWVAASAIVSFLLGLVAFGFGISLRLGTGPSDWGRALSWIAFGFSFLFIVITFLIFFGFLDSQLG